MERGTFVVQLRFSRVHALWALALALLCVHPGELGSEQLTLTTYYPAPYGVYRDMLTTMNTTLSRDAGGGTAIGSGGVNAGYKGQVNGNLNVTGTSQAATLSVTGNATIGGLLTAGNINASNLTATNATINTANITQLNLSNGSFTGAISLSGYISGACVTRYYGAGTWGCAWNETALNNWPTGFSTFGPLATMSGQGAYFAIPNVDGWMWCCRFR